MDSHQSDLAEEMDKKGWATVCWKPECVSYRSVGPLARLRGFLRALTLGELYPPVDRDLPITLRKLAAAKPATEPHSGGAAKSAFPALDKGKVQRILDEVLGYA